MQLNNNIVTVWHENNYTFTDVTSRLLSPVDLTVNNTCSIWAQHNLILELVSGHLEETDKFVFVNFSSKW